MTNSGKLTALIERAIKNGWKHDEYYDGGYPYYMIWQHLFAKALFGNQEHIAQYGSEHLTCCYCHSDDLPEYCFEAHLQQAVVNPDPIGYMYGVAFGD